MTEKTGEQLAEQVNALVAITDSESDRGCVLVVGCVLDEALADAIHAEFLKRYPGGEKVAKELLFKRPMPPLGSFAIRAKIALALGIIDKAAFDTIDVIRDMRNAAGHLSAPFSLSAYRLDTVLPQLSEKERKLIEAYGDIVSRARGTLTPAPASPERFRFNIAAISIYARLLITLRTSGTGSMAVFVADAGILDAAYDAFLQKLSESGSSRDIKSEAQE